MLKFLEENIAAILMVVMLLAFLFLFPEEAKIIVQGFNSSPLSPLYFSK